LENMVIPNAARIKSFSASAISIPGVKS
jgi:hypothetical protein